MRAEDLDEKFPVVKIDSAALDAVRATQLDRKKSAHQTDALLGFLVWALVGGGVAYVWFRRIPWD